jgi:hypothetical protein
MQNQIVSPLGNNPFECILTDADIKELLNGNIKALRLKSGASMYSSSY